MSEWPLSDGDRPEVARGLCPECGGEVSRAAEPGGVSRCPRCRSWLYESLFDETAIEPPDGAPCARCGSARLGDSCTPCSGEEARQRQSRKRRRAAEAVDGVIRVLPLDSIEGDGQGLRHAVDIRAFDRLRCSIAAIGIVEPILVRPTCIGTFEIVDGFRRWLALRQLGCPAIAARVVSMTTEQRARWRLAANLHREALAPLDEAESFFGAVGEARGDKRVIAAALGLDRRRIEQLVRECSRDAARYEAEVYGTDRAAPAERADERRPAEEWSDQIDLSAEPTAGSAPDVPVTGETWNYGPQESIDLSTEEAAEGTNEGDGSTREPPEFVSAGRNAAEAHVTRSSSTGQSTWTPMSAGEGPSMNSENRAEQAPATREPAGLRLVSGAALERKVLDELKGRVEE